MLLGPPAVGKHTVVSLNRLNQQADKTENITKEGMDNFKTRLKLK